MGGEKPSVHLAIPTENLLALTQRHGTKVLVKTDDIEDSKSVAHALERGVDGFLVSDPEKVREFCSLYKPGLEFNGDHPIVYVGKDQHGSYHNQGGAGDSLSGFSYCFYFNACLIFDCYDSIFYFLYYDFV